MSTGDEDVSSKHGRYSHDLLSRVFRVFSYAAILLIVGSSLRGIPRNIRDRGNIHTSIKNNVSGAFILAHAHIYTTLCACISRAYRMHSRHKVSSKCWL